MECNLIGTLNIYKSMGIVPNFSALSKEFKKDRHTIKKMYEGKKEVKFKKKKESIFDQFIDDIKDLLLNPGVTVKAAYWYLKNEKSLKGTYSGFKTYVRINKIRENLCLSTAHPLYETDPGDMVQVDWVENIKMTSYLGEVINFNLFSATLGCSRLHYFEYTETKTEVDFKNCCIHYFKKIGGLPRRILTDNMTAIVSVNGNERRKHQSIIQFEKDIGIPITLCKVRTPETKGKDEVSNKYAQWLKAYDGRFKNKEDLLRIINRLNIDINKEVNTGTNMPPILLFQKEKEYLRPLPNLSLLDSYLDDGYPCKVPSTFLVNYKGGKYSVPPYLINKTVIIKERLSTIFIYYHDELITEHVLAKPKSINYKEDHYRLGLIGKFKNEEDIENTTKLNLEKFKNLGEKE